MLTVESWAVYGELQLLLNLGSVNWGLQTLLEGYELYQSVLSLGGCGCITPMPASHLTCLYFNAGACHFMRYCSTGV